MIEVLNLTKRYAGHPAVADVSFEVARGEIVGLLGPNGAGKSTILRILACFLPGTSGTVRVAGYDVFHQATEVRRRIGYMPEHNPLPLEMRVHEYLRFRARLKGLSLAQTRERVATVMRQCELEGVAKKPIAFLSKGFRQRVGLADALVHEPELIILDEPTIGLDPHQIRSVRQLIKNLGKTHTILLSTHILPEVELTCPRVLILHEGRILADDTAEHLQRTLFGSSPIIAEIAAPVAEIRECWSEHDEIEHLDISPLDGDYHRCALTPANGADLRPLVFTSVREHGWTLRELTRNRHTLEDIFVRVTRPEKEEAEP